MAQCVRYICDNCLRVVKSWSDGNPYFINEHGNKQYAYHPNYDDLERCIGNDIPYFCLACGEELEVDSLEPNLQCIKCQSKDTVEISDLD